MYYICVEDGRMTGILDYEPNVPDSVTVITITDEEYRAIDFEKTHVFDMDTLTVIAKLESVINQEAAKKAQEILNAENREVLRNSDWKVLRHMRELALNQPTTLSNEEYIALEQSRADAAAAIVEIQ